MHHIEIALAMLEVDATTAGLFREWLAQKPHKTFVREKRNQARVNAARLEYRHET